jgi:transcriptional regulator with GAF, ATPase, and Fis domain
LTNLITGPQSEKNEKSMDKKQASKKTPVNLLLEISREVTAALDLHTVLERVLVLSAGSIGVERASLIVLDDRRKPIDAAIMVDGKIIAHRSDQLQATIENGLAGWVLREGKPALIQDTSKDPRWLRGRMTRPINPARNPSSACLCYNENPWWAFLPSSTQTQFDHTG